MAARIIDGKAVAASVQEQLARDVEELTRAGCRPGLGVVLVGDDPASRVYVNMKRKACGRLGLHSDEVTLPAQVTQDELLGHVRRFNDAPEIHGILVQLPLPKHVETTVVLESVSPAKDADCFHPMNVGRLFLGYGRLFPCTPLGVMKLLESAGCDLTGKRAVVIGRSNIVGKPLAAMLTQRHATVTVCHTRTRDLADEVARADVVVAAAGAPRSVRGDWIKPGAVVIDVGTNRVGDRLVGDVEFDVAVQRASAITPVPGGVGPMTIAMLMANTVQLARESLAARRP